MTVGEQARAPQISLIKICTVGFIEFTQTFRSEFSRNNRQMDVCPTEAREEAASGQTGSGIEV